MGYFSWDLKTSEAESVFRGGKFFHVHMLGDGINQKSDRLQQVKVSYLLYGFEGGC